MKSTFLFYFLSLFWIGMLILFQVHMKLRRFKCNLCPKGIFEDSNFVDLRSEKWMVELGVRKSTRVNVPLWPIYTRIWFYIKLLCCVNSSKESLYEKTTCWFQIKFITTYYLQMNKTLQLYEHIYI